MKRLQVLLDHESKVPKEDSTAVDSHCPPPSSTSVTAKASSAIIIPRKLFNIATKPKPDLEMVLLPFHVTLSVQYCVYNLSVGKAEIEMDTDEQELCERHKTRDGDDMDWKAETASQDVCDMFAFLFL